MYTYSQMPDRSSGMVKEVPEETVIAGRWLELPNLFDHNRV